MERCDIGPKCPLLAAVKRVHQPKSHSAKEGKQGVRARSRAFSAEQHCRLFRIHQRQERAASPCSRTNQSTRVSPPRANTGLDCWRRGRTPGIRTYSTRDIGYQVPSAPPLRAEWSHRSCALLAVYLHCHQVVSTHWELGNLARDSWETSRRPETVDHAQHRLLGSDMMQDNTSALWGLKACGLGVLCTEPKSPRTPCRSGDSQYVQ